jgi:hypothetical protein
MTVQPRKYLGACVLLLLAGCGGDGEVEPTAVSAVTTLVSPAGPGSSEPNLAVGADGTVYLSWQEPAGSGHELRFARLEGDSWSEARAIARGDDWFVNWADFPSLAVLPDGRLVAHYLRRNPTGETYHYDIEIVQSEDSGESWTGPVRPHRDSVPAEHGFVSIFPDDGGAASVVWLDGRQYDERFGGSEEMMLRHTTLHADGRLGEDAVIDPRVCDCCQTDWGITTEGPVVAYRGRSEGEIRDIHLARRVEGVWTRSTVHDDGWEIAACPVNGPAVAADGDRVAVAWFTAARDTPRVRVAFSSDAGRSFSEPVDVDGGNPSGRVDLVLLEDGRAVVTWLERGAGDGAEIRARAVSRDAVGEPMVIARSSQTRSSGFPRMARSGEELVFAWTDAGDASSVRVARARLEGAR